MVKDFRHFDSQIIYVVWGKARDMAGRARNVNQGATRPAQQVVVVVVFLQLVAGGTVIGCHPPHQAHFRERVESVIETEPIRSVTFAAIASASACRLFFSTASVAIRGEVTRRPRERSALARLSFVTSNSILHYLDHVQRTI